MSLKEIRKSKNITQLEASKYVGIPLRTYVNYENDLSKNDSVKYKYILNKILEYGYVDDKHGILKIEDIKTLVSGICAKYKVDYCYLFGSYAKGKAREGSDVDLLIGSSLTGLKFFSLVEEIRETLNKNVDVLDQNQLKNNIVITNEILKDGIKIYG